MKFAARRRFLMLAALWVYGTPALAQGVGFGPDTAYQPVPLTGTAFVPNLEISANLLLKLVHGTCPCTLANMINAPAGRANQNVMRFIQSTAGGETIAMSGSQYAGSIAVWGANLPIIADAGAKTDLLYYIDADGLVQLTMSLGPPSLSNLAPNQITGGDGMTSGWTAVGTGFLPGPTGLAPDFSNNAATLPEDGTPGTHLVSQHNTGLSAGIVTASVFVKEKTGTRLVELRLADNSFANVASVTADPVACVITSASAGTIGAGNVSAADTIPGRPNGYCEVWFQATLGGAGAPVFMNVELSTPGGDNYPGDGSSALYVWRPAVRAGVKSPP
jgi:hypothetical protein